MKKGYSAVEVVLVVIFLAIVISVIVHRYNVIEKEAKEILRKNEVQILNYGIQLYRIKKGRYPSSILDVLEAGILDNETIEIFSKNSKIKDKNVYDPFGEVYRYDNVSGKVW